jgi:hypothetical protein
LTLLYVVGVAGAFLQISGGTWDVASHALGIPETFFTPSHLILYTGVAAAGLAGLAGLTVRTTTNGADVGGRRLVAGLQVSLAGSVLQVVAGPADFWWHDTFGFDPFLLTPSHTLLIVGIVLVGLGMAMGSARLLKAHAPRESAILGRRSLEALVVVAFAVLWLDLNGLVYLLTDVNGIAYTFGLGAGFVTRFEPVAFAVAPVALALTGTLVLLAVRRVIRRRGAATAVAVLGAAIVVLGNVAFRAWYLRGTLEGAALAGFIPLYLAFLVPVALFDLSLGGPDGRFRILVAAALAAPFLSFLDGWHGTFLWTTGHALLPWFVVPMALAGAVAGLLSVRFADALLARAGPAAASA